MKNVGKPIPHDSARGHVTGQATYIDDYVPVVGELFVELVGSPSARGQIKGIDTSKASQLPGVVTVLTAEDIVGENRFGIVISEEPVLAENSVHYVGQPVVVIAAESREAAARSRQLVHIEIKEQAPIFSIDEAIVQHQFIGPPRQIRRGDPDVALDSAPHRLSGTFLSGGQDQFYLEGQASIAYPEEDGRVVVHCSTQNPTEIQQVVSEVLGIGQHEVVCICKRMGGAFGGKETQAAIPAVAAAMVAASTGRSARLILNKDDDMCWTGKRHPYQSAYDIGFDEEGRILAAKLDFYSNGGAFADLSTSVLERTMLHAENAYYIPNIEINAQVCRTNYPPNTAFRGFGGPQGMAVIENAMQEIAIQLQMDALDVRRINCYGKTERNITPYGQILRGNLLPDVFDQLERSSDYRGRVQTMAKFNVSSRTHLKGIAMTPVKFGISFTTAFLNQGNALVNVYTDGTVQVSTGATEMGQGVNTKIRQLVADEFGLEVQRVRMMDTSTEKNNNTSASAASATTDLNGAAAVNACRKIKKLMARFAAETFAVAEAGFFPDAESIRFSEGSVFDIRKPDSKTTFSDFTDLAHRSRVDLGARGFYATPGVDFNRETGRGNPFYYFTTGCAVAEVTVDVFTGDLKVDRVDLLMDIGQQINPGIERGQVIGGFVQGMGYVTAEELKYDDAGHLLSHSPTTYKIPNITDIPEVFHVGFVDNHENARNIRSSKAVGEPPLMLALSVWAAVKNALSFASSGAVPDLSIPATNEAILMCLTKLRSDAGADDTDSIVADTV